MPAGTAGRINSKDVLVDVKVRIGQKFDYNEGVDNLLPALSNDYVYLDYNGIRAHGFDADSFEVAVGEACLKEKFVSRYFTRTQIERSRSSGGSMDQILHHAENGFNKELSGGVMIVPKEGSFFSNGLQEQLMAPLMNTIHMYRSYFTVPLFGKDIFRHRFLRLSFPVHYVFF